MERQNAYAHIQEKALKSESFRQELLSNPKAVLERELDIVLPASVTIQVYEETPTTLYIVLPPRPSVEGVRSLSDEELAEAAGGRDCSPARSGCSVASFVGVFC